MERKLAAILAADVVGYAALMERDEKGTHERLKAGRKELFEPPVSAKNLFATEQDLSDVARRRERWKAYESRLDAARGWSASTRSRIKSGAGFGPRPINAFARLEAARAQALGHSAAGPLVDEDLLWRTKTFSGGLAGRPDTFEYSRQIRSHPRNPGS